MDGPMRPAAIGLYPRAVHARAAPVGRTWHSESKGYFPRALGSPSRRGTQLTQWDARTYRSHVHIVHQRFANNQTLRRQGVLPPVQALEPRPWPPAPKLKPLQPSAHQRHTAEATERLMRNTMSAVELRRTLSKRSAGLRPSTSLTSLSTSRPAVAAALPPAFAPIAIPAAKPLPPQIGSHDKFMAMAVEAINSRFSNMHRAFQKYDTNGDGSLDTKELRQALISWNLPPDAVAYLVDACDADADGRVDYKEFVDKLARDTVTVAAMGKRGMQAEEAMGVAAFDSYWTGHVGAPKNYRVGA